MSFRQVSTGIQT